MDKDTTKSTFIQLFESIFTKDFFKAMSDKGVDRYTKKLFAKPFIQILTYAVIQNLDGLRDISASLANPVLSQALRLKSISHSQIARRLNQFPTEILQNLFINLSWQLRRETGYHLNLIDSTTISLAVRRSSWAKFRKARCGVKLHLRVCFDYETTFPEQVSITPAKVADKKELNSLIVEDPDAIHVFDRGYVDYHLYSQYIERKVRFATRLKDNALIEVISVILNPQVKREAVILLGEGKKRVKHPLRLIEAYDSENRLIQIISNDFETPAEEIAEIYHKRWQIELFFKWLKQHFTVKHFTVKHFYGISQTGVENQIYIALMAYCLMMLGKRRTASEKTLWEWVRLLKNYWFKPFTTFIQRLHQKPLRTSQGRRRIDYETIYQMTERQVIETLEAGHLNDLTYDPLIL